MSNHLLRPPGPKDWKEEEADFYRLVRKGGGNIKDARLFWSNINTDDLEPYEDGDTLAKQFLEDTAGDRK